VEELYQTDIAAAPPEPVQIPPAPRIVLKGLIEDADPVWNNTSIVKAPVPKLTPGFMVKEDDAAPDICAQVVTAVVVVVVVAAEHAVQVPLEFPWHPTA